VCACVRACDRASAQDQDPVRVWDQRGLCDLVQCRTLRWLSLNVSSSHRKTRSQNNCHNCVDNYCCQGRLFDKTWLTEKHVALGVATVHFKSHVFQKVHLVH